MKEVELRRERQQLEAEKEAMKTLDTSGEDVIALNVSGKHIDVLRRTLCLIEGSLLATMFSGRWGKDL